jgi:hypothetical protein
VLFYEKPEIALTTDIRNNLDEGIEDTKFGLLWHNLSK